MASLTPFELFARLPKAELHLHIEGTLEPEMMFELAKKNHITLKYTSVEECRDAYNFSNLQSFLDIYYQGANVLVDEEDFYAMTFAYIRKAAADNIKHIEIFFDPQTHTARNVSFQTVVTGISRALSEGKKSLGVSYRLIMCFLRHLTEEDAFNTLDQALPFRTLIDGIGLDSSEVGHPPSKFARVFAKCRELGWFVVAHAGEEGPPAFIHEALDLLKVQRIDHGVRCMEDEELMEQLKKDQIHLTVCPLSNLKLKVVSGLDRHPVKKMLSAGLNVSINSDDPAFFGGYLNENGRQICDALNLSHKEVAMLAMNSIRGSFLSDEEKSTLLAKIDSEVCSL